MTKISAVLFDIGNVLVEWRPERIYDPLMSAAARDYLFYDIGLHAMNEAVDAGAPFYASVTGLAEQNPDHAAQILMWRDRWSEMFAPAIDRSVDLLRALRAKGVPVFALSNFGDETFTMAEAKYPFLAEFDRRYISARMGVIKPNPAIYERVEADCGLPPESLLFVDDRAENIAAARARGWRGHVFTGPDGWAVDLVAHGLLTEAEAGV